MKKRFLLSIACLAASLTLLFAGCGEGKGAEDTKGDGHVGGSTSHNSANTTADTGHSTKSDTDGNTASTAGNNARNGFGSGLNGDMNANGSDGIF